MGKNLIFRIGVATLAIKPSWQRRWGVFRYIAEHANLQAVSLERLMTAQQLEPNTIRGEHLDGLLCGSTDLAKRLVADPLDIPVVYIDSNPDLPLPPHPAEVQLDDEEVVSAAVELGLRRRHTNFAYVGTDQKIERWRSNVRKGIFARLLGRHGQSVASFDFFDFTDQEQRRNALSGWLTALTKPCFILAYNDTAAAETLETCHAAHLSVPDQVNLVGVDNATEICETIRPQLTSIEPDFELGGYIAARALHRVLRHGPPQRTLKLSYGIKTLVERSTTRDLRGGGFLVSRALEILQKDFDNPRTTAESLAAHLSASRRLLDLRFRAIVGCPVHAELERLRIEKAKSLLSNTDLMVSEIAKRCGYKATNTFRNAFRSLTGLAPTDYHP